MSYRVYAIPVVYLALAIGLLRAQDVPTAPPPTPKKDGVKVSPPPKIAIPPVKPRTPTAADIKIEGPSTGKYLVHYRLLDLPPGAGATWRVYPRKTAELVVGVDNSLTVAGPPGEYEAEVDVAVYDKAADRIYTRTLLREFKLTGGGVEPSPKPPTPDPTPKPPQPDPTPKPSTVLKVLLVYQDNDPATKTGLLYGKALEDWMTANCSGGKAGWGRRDVDFNPAVDTSPLKDVWEKAAATAKTKQLPIMVILTDDFLGYEPLGPTAADAINVLTKYKEGR